MSHVARYGSHLAVVAGAALVAVAGDDGAVYDNRHTGVSTFADPAQIFEPPFQSYDIWLGDDFEISEAFTNLEISSTGFCTDGCVDPFAVTDFLAAIWDGLPNDENSQLVIASINFSYDGVDTWTAVFGEQTLEPGHYVFAFAADLDFVDGRTFFFQQPRDGENDGFLWNPGQAFGFPDDLHMIEDGNGQPSSPNACIDGDPVACAADCDGNRQLNVLDFVCFQLEWSNQTSKGDCNADGAYDVLDFVCFQGEFNDGCD